MGPSGASRCGASAFGKGGPYSASNDLIPLRTVTPEYARPVTDSLMKTVNSRLAPESRHAQTPIVHSREPDATRQPITT